MGNKKEQISMQKCTVCITCLVIILVITQLTSCAKPLDKLSVTELLDLGEKYLLDMNYEQAVICFNKLIDIEPMNPRGYTGLAEAYIGLGDTDKAVEILQKGIDVLPDNTEIQARLVSIEQMPSQEAITDTLTEQSPELTAKEEPPLTDEEIQFYDSLTTEQKDLLTELEEAMSMRDYETTRNILASEAYKEILIIQEYQQKMRLSTGFRIECINYGIYDNYAVVIKPSDYSTGNYVRAIYRIWDNEIEYYFDAVQYKDGIANGDYLQIREEYDNDGDVHLCHETGQALNGFKQGEEIVYDYDTFRGSLRHEMTVLQIYDEGKIVPFGKHEDGDIYSGKIIEYKGWQEDNYFEYSSTDAEQLEKIESFPHLDDL